MIIGGLVLSILSFLAVVVHCLYRSYDRYYFLKHIDDYAANVTAENANPPPYPVPNETQNSEQEPEPTKSQQ
ncbi:hypothetical protein SprV_0902711000 [Sparganum proliferum]